MLFFGLSKNAKLCFIFYFLLWGDFVSIVSIGVSSSNIAIGDMRFGDMFGYILPLKIMVALGLKVLLIVPTVDPS